MAAAWTARHALAPCWDNRSQARTCPCYTIATRASALTTRTRASSLLGLWLLWLAITSLTNARAIACLASAAAWSARFIAEASTALREGEEAVCTQVEYPMRSCAYFICSYHSLATRTESSSCWTMAISPSTPDSARRASLNDDRIQASYIHLIQVQVSTS